MKIRLGLLPVSFLALGLAVTAFHMQGTQAEPVAVADFGSTPAFAAEMDAAQDETTAMDQDAWLHPAAAHEMKDMCAGSEGVNLISLTDKVSMICHDEAAAGYIMTTPGVAPKLVLLPETAQEQCPSKAAKDDAEPSA